MFLLLVGLVASPLFSVVLATDPMPLAPMPPVAPVQPLTPVPTPAVSLQPQNNPFDLPPASFAAPAPLAPMPPVAPGLAPPLPLTDAANQPLVPPQPLGAPTPGPVPPFDTTPVHPPFPMPVPDQVPPGGIGNSSIFTAKLREPAPGDDELQRLLIARFNEAVKELRAATAMYRMGAGTFDSVITSAGHVLHAGLELGDKPADQIAMLEGYLEYAKQLEAQVKSLYDSASRGGESDKMYQATYLRLGADIELLRAKRKAGLAK